MLTHVLEGKVGRDALGHYGITPAGSSSAAPPTPASPNPTPAAPTPTTARAAENGDVEMANGSSGANGNSENRPNGDSNEDEGVFL